MIHRGGPVSNVIMNSCVCHLPLLIEHGHYQYMLLYWHDYGFEDSVQDTTCPNDESRGGPVGTVLVTC